MFRTTVFALSLALVPATAFAGSVELTKPMQAGTLNDGNIDMSVYFVESEGVYHVVATYADTEAAYDSQRMMMEFAEGDAASFSLPGLDHITYSFDRIGESLRVDAVEQDVKTTMLR